MQRTSRLLVECNRSIGHPQLWSEFSRDLPEVEKTRILDHYWRPHREAVRQMIEVRPPGLVVHVSVHSFTPEWKGKRRATDIGVLHDPTRKAEARLASLWRSYLSDSSPLTVHRNRPYRGWTDGLTTTIRQEMPEGRYVGIELEVSQALMPSSGNLTGLLARGLSTAVRGLA